ncbi:hypothetical protein ACFPES_32610 [Paenibacillus sp. GCM10023248]|uniref:hypothetical protein n=1 Tax=Bacillales TaxID=1385 RepID=UPI002379E1E6|nr:MULTISPECIES: hypothetical protein [Bacillales]MDD9271782.1 hypothetical protein [Paenibacillus sp. MAHUQ-63]MDR6884665.1 hypothetical protein [Bacillus sp. 3255]
MSEFSESYHLKTLDQTKAVTLLRDSEMSGYVFGEQNGWVSFVIDYRGRNANDVLSESNPSLFIHYVYLEDHMWSLKIYEKDELVFDYKADWAGESLVIEKDLFNLPYLENLILAQGNPIGDLEQIFDFKDSKLSYENPPAYLIAQRIGLTHYEWVSSDHLSGYNSQQLEEMDVLYVE